MRLGDFLIGIVYLAMLFVLVRPGSPAAGAVKNISNTLIWIVGSATGYTQTGVTV